MIGPGRRLQGIRAGGEGVELGLELVELERLDQIVGGAAVQRTRDGVDLARP